MAISSRTPEGSPDLCPVCGSVLEIDPSDPADDAPCPRCGHLLWFLREDLGEAQVIRLTCSTLRPRDLDRFIETASVRPGMRLVMDFGEVRFLSGDFLGGLLDLKKKLAAVGGSSEGRKSPP